MNENSKNPQAHKPIGLFDSGLGGLTVLRAMKEHFPDESFVYLGDSARTPYGTKSPETICEYSEECAEFLNGHDIKMLIIACNTASSFALDKLRDKLPYPVIGTVQPASEMVAEKSASGRIGVIGTEGTVSSNAYRDAIERLRADAQVFSKPCPLYVPFVEQGITSGPMIDEACRLYLSGLRSLRVDHLVLGCTHYPLLRDAIQNFMGESVEVVCCADAVAAEAKRVLREDGSLAAQKSSDDLFYVTDGAIRFRFLASKLLGSEPVEVLHIHNLASESQSKQHLRAVGE